MSLIDRAVYLITVHNPPKDIDIKLNRFLQQNEIVIKKTVKGERFVNIKPMILKADILGSQETDTAMEVVLSTGSREYLNPEHMIKHFLRMQKGMILRHILIFTALIC